MKNICLNFMMVNCVIARRFSNVTPSGFLFNLMLPSILMSCLRDCMDYFRIKIIK
jgi:hypothetical protein